ncbi:glycosyltransferase family 4 protein [Candidatus Fermentibacteria bacterium]|nr:glycosyltransferase family 4 protein [Candidatus Fermentibacteria bacterium]
MGVDGVDGGRPLRVVFFGSYDTHRPRFRILRRGLSLSGDSIAECHASVWGSLEDRSHIRTPIGYLLPAIKWCSALPRLMRAYHALPPHDVVLVPYLGPGDAVIAKHVARRSRVPVVYDPYVSLYETVIGDRQMAGPRSVTGRAVRMLDVWAFRAADAILVDTSSHGNLMAEQLDLPMPRRFVVPVGAESEVFTRSPLPPRSHLHRVLFYGSMIPLHGIETIIRAIRELGDSLTRFTLIGTGQEYAKARALAKELSADRSIDWVDRVTYGRLPGEIEQADVCLGIFGGSRKAHSVVPNKVFQALACGRPVITADTPAIREWFTDGEDCILVPPGDHRGLAYAIGRVLADSTLQEQLAQKGYELFTRAFAPTAVGATAHRALEAVVSGHRPASPDCPGEQGGTQER